MSVLGSLEPGRSPEWAAWEGWGDRGGRGNRVGRGGCPALGFHCVGYLRQGAGWWSPVGSTGGPDTDGLGPGGVRRFPILVLLYELGPFSLRLSKDCPAVLMQDSVGTGESLCPGTGWGFPIDLNLGAAGWNGDTSGQRQPVCLGPREGRAGLPGPAPGPCLQPSREGRWRR